MRHMRSISQVPAKAFGYQEIINGIGLVSALLSLYQAISNTFGLTIPQKNNDDSQEPGES